MKYFPYRVLFILSFLLPGTVKAVPKDWKTLTNKNGWMIKYPKDWMIDENFDGSYALNPPINGDVDSKDAFSPEICGPAKALKSGAQAGCVRVKSASGKINNGKPDLIPESLEKVMRRVLTKIDKNSVHDLTVQNFPAYSATGFLNAHSALLPMKKILIRTKRGIVEVEYYEIKGNRDNFLQANLWIYEKTFEEIFSTLVFNI